MDDQPLLMSLRLGSLEDTDRFGRLMVTRLPDGACIGLVGTLGAGKTYLVQAILSAAGVPREAIVSPTFSLLKSYAVGPREYHHLDAYRLEDEDEFYELGVEEFLGAPHTVALIEWADRVQGALPRETLWLRLDWLNETHRQLDCYGNTERWSEFATSLQADFDGC